MQLLNKESTKLFSGLNDINNGFRIPDKSYIYGKDLSHFKELKAHLYFSNFWCVKKPNDEIFAQALAQYFKDEYDKEFSQNSIDQTKGFVAMWYLKDYSLIANFNLEDSLAFWAYPDFIPPKLVSIVNSCQAIRVLYDNNDNCVYDLFFSQEIKNKICEEQLRKEFLYCVCDSYLQEFNNVINKDKNMIKTNY